MQGWTVQHSQGAGLESKASPLGLHGWEALNAEANGPEPDPGKRGYPSGNPEDPVRESCLGDILAPPHCALCSGTPKTWGGGRKPFRTHRAKDSLRGWGLAGGAPAGILREVIKAQSRR